LHQTDGRAVQSTLISRVVGMELKSQAGHI